jgi:hypothetical protein
MAITSYASQHDLTIRTNNNNAIRRTTSLTPVQRDALTESSAERSVRRRGKADNEADPSRSVATSGFPAREFQGGPECKNSTCEAGYTTAADSLRQETERLDLDPQPG